MFNISFQFNNNWNLEKRHEREDETESGQRDLFVTRQIYKNSFGIDFIESPRR